uniref:Uncharacterized protein n=1 Tax=Pararge aegeria TaxID=116150 RepID=S4P9Z5_9NEOP
MGSLNSVMILVNISSDRIPLHSIVNQISKRIRTQLKRNTMKEIVLNGKWFKENCIKQERVQGYRYPHTFQITKDKIKS